MISILIPTYNYNIFQLVETLQKQCVSATIGFEILVLDDASTNKKIIEENSKINVFQNCSFQILDENIGRSKIRNLLAERAKYNWLLFLDADTFPSNSLFIEKYLASFTAETSVIFGGIEYPENTSDKVSLRYKYGSKRESLSLEKRLLHPYRSFITMGFAIKKEVFEKIRFNEKLAGYGYEDSVFAYGLQENNITLTHIENPVFHLNLETNEEFIAKSELALQNLLSFYENNVIDVATVKILKIHLKLKKLQLSLVIRWIFEISKIQMLKNLRSSAPSLFLFDMYRLGYLNSLKSKNA